MADESTRISSTMICPKPNASGHRFLISACDAVWDPGRFLPLEISRLVTDQNGDPAPDYGGFLQFPVPSVLEMLEAYDLFAGFRAVQDTYLNYINEAPPTATYERLRGNLVRVGWDVCTGNGWLSASAHGCFPINGITGEIDETNGFRPNEWGLLPVFEDALMWCSRNSTEIPEHAPWYPVEILLDEGSFHRLRASRAKVG